MSMRFASGISDAVNAREALDAACGQALEPLAGLSCDLAFLFASTVYRTDWPDLVERLQDRLKPTVLIGCSGSGIIGGGKELEWVPGISLVAAHLPGVRLFPFTVTPDEIEVAGQGGFWIDKVGAAPHARPSFVAFIDPQTTNPTTFLAQINATYHQRPMIGGLVSGGSEAGERFLILDRQVRHEGVVGVAMTGNVVMHTVISQGCRPIGRPFVVTEAEDNIIWRLGGKQALVILHEVLSTLSSDDRDLAQRGSIFAGLAMHEARHAFASGDFLIRNIVGIDPDKGAIAIAEQVQVGQTLQFQLRDPATSRQELRRLLCQVDEAHAVVPPAGCLLFNCTGRGRSLYGIPHQDVKTIQVISGKLPIGGFFCSGEIGPVGGTNFVHGYTASLGLFRPLSAVASRRHESQARGQDEALAPSSS